MRKETAINGPVLVTGASQGLGLSTAVALAARGRPVILGCRDAARGMAAASEVRARVPGADARVLELDLADLASVASAAAGLAAGPPLRALVCNAGVQVLKGVARSADGFELTFATNHLGHHLLARLLLDGPAAPERVVVVASGVHMGLQRPQSSLGFPSPRWADPRVLADADHAARDGSARAGRVRYATSKLANVLFTYELARRLEGRATTVTAFDPGLMPRTGLARDYPRAVQKIYRGAAPLMVKLIPSARSPERSASDLAWLADDSNVQGISGAYFVGRKQVRSSRESYSEVLSEQLWSVSEELVREKYSGSERSPRRNHR
jgi:NAD(P)-dependent dehydrogenase (short-subunit alcohol dehydrogenase family)